MAEKSLNPSEHLAAPLPIGRAMIIFKSTSRTQQGISEKSSLFSEIRHYDWLSKIKG